MKFISLFSGAGGLDLGFEQSGFKPIIAYDNKKAAINTYNLNRNGEIAKHLDLAGASAEEIIRDIRERNGFEHINGVIGGPPCQYFSLGNRASIDSIESMTYAPKLHQALALCLAFWVVCPDQKIDPGQSFLPRRGRKVSLFFSSLVPL